MADPNPDAEDYYERLGVDPESSQEEIDRAASVARARHKPRTGDPDDEEAWYRIKEAVETLTDPEARAAYDEGEPDAGTAGADDGESEPDDGTGADAADEAAAEDADRAAEAGGEPDYETPDPMAEDLYARIGVPPDADRVTVMKRAAAAKSEFDPARMTEADEADFDRWERLLEAVEVLTDAERRASYDERRAE